jgi:hypothetical protein
MIEKATSNIWGIVDERNGILGEKYKDREGWKKLFKVCRESATSETAAENGIVCYVWNFHDAGYSRKYER